MKDSFDDLFNINPTYSTSIAFILGLLLVSDLNTPEQNMLGNWIILLGQTILTNASAQNVIESRLKGNRYNINSKEVKSFYNPIYYDINKIKDIIKKVYPNTNNELNIIKNCLDELNNKIEELKKTNFQ
jgi:hypothetical protein